MKSPISLFDIQGLAFGVGMCSLGVTLLKAGGLVTGQTAGLALLLSYVMPLSFGTIFFVVGLPFLYLAWQRRGTEFAVRTVIAMIGISAGGQIVPMFMSFEHLNGLVAAVLGGACSGMGLIAIFRHNASAGGMTILGIIIEHRTGFKAGWFQVIVDAIVFGAAAFVLTWEQLLYSFIGAMVTNFAIVWNFDVAQSGTGRPGYGKAAPKGAISDD